MKKSIYTLFIIVTSLLTFASFASAEDNCSSKLSDHLSLIEESDELILELSQRSKEITSFEITELQKNMTARYLSLKNLIAVYENSANHCSPKVVGKAIAIYDFSDIGLKVFSNTELRRVVKGFKKFKGFQLSDYLAQYEKYTSNEFIEKIQLEIIQAGYSLPSGVEIKTSSLEYDPKLHAFSDSAIQGTTSMVAGVARIWGFVSDHLKWRKGKLNNNLVIKHYVESKLKPLDLVYEKRTFVLSNYTIPGHWGHVGIWLGTKEELIAMGIWDKDYFLPFQKYVEEGKNIIEVRKPGINFQGLDTFLNLDEFAITRVGHLDGRQPEIYAEIFNQVQKKYDFKFDARTADKITCTELITFSYGDIKWPETKTLFQLSIRPDDIAKMTLDSSSDQEFIMYLKGNKNNQPISNLGFEEWSKVFQTKKK
jgi:uncharacterized protein YycO